MLWNFNCAIFLFFYRSLNGLAHNLAVRLLFSFFGLGIPSHLFYPFLSSCWGYRWADSSGSPSVSFFNKIINILKKIKNKKANKGWNWEWSLITQLFCKKCTVREVEASKQFYECKTRELLQKRIKSISKLWSFVSLLRKVQI